MQPLPGFHTTNPRKNFRLKKSFYGLRQAPSCWFSKLTTAVQKFGFVQSYAAYCLFTYLAGDVFLCVLIYVDDLLFIDISLSEYKSLKLL